ncbi:hypothetical protein [Burkholderia territorii]|nr:hypothetical protein [Burkholderia territorii]
MYPLLVIQSTCYSRLHPTTRGSAHTHRGCDRRHTERRMPHARDRHHAARAAYALRSPEHAVAERRAAAVARDEHRRTHADLLASIRLKLGHARARAHQMRRMQIRTLTARIGCTGHISHGHRAVHATATSGNGAGGDIAYQLVRNQTMMQHLRNRLAAHDHVAEQRDRAVPGPGHVLHEAVDDHRVAFVFGTTPDKSVRDLMTRHGFVFDARRSPDGQWTWGRKRTPTAIMVAQRLLPKLDALMIPTSSVANPDCLAARRCRFALTGDATALDEVAA